MTGNWVLPNVGTPGTIQNTILGGNGYLSPQKVSNSSIEAGSTVEGVALDVNDTLQQWERSAEDESGYFTLKNLESGKFLTGHNPPNTLTIEGMCT